MKYFFFFLKKIFLKSLPKYILNKDEQFKHYINKNHEEKTELLG